MRVPPRTSAWLYDKSSVHPGFVVTNPGWTLELPGMVERMLTEPIRKDLERKIVLVAGPRQCGKTTLSRSLFGEYQYLNYDAPPDRLLIGRREWLRTAPLVIFAELHKMPQWKRWLKGIYDTESIPPRLL